MPSFLASPGQILGLRLSGAEPPLEQHQTEMARAAHRLGPPPAGSSPAKQQQQLGLNRDVTLHPKQGEGETLRK